MNVLFLRTKEEAVPEIMSLFGALGDAEAVLETVTGEGSGIDMIEGADILSRSLIGNSSDFAARVKSEITGSFWSRLYDSARNLIINDDEIKDNIIYLTPRILRIAGFIELSEGEIRTDFMSISDRSTDPETKQCYYFRNLGFGEEAALYLIAPFKNLDILKAESREQGTALDSLLTVVSELKAVEACLGTGFLKHREHLAQIVWNAVKAEKCREYLKNVRSCLEAARPLIFRPLRES